MKVKKVFGRKFRIFAIAVTGFFCMEQGFSTGMAVFDAANWLGTIENLYASYDMVMNTVQQIENQYKQIQQAVNAAKGIDWENVQFDGDFDIRDDIKNANKRVNRLLTQVNNIEKSITSPDIQIGNKAFSISDLCNVTNSGSVGLADAFNAAGEYMTDSMKAAVDSVTKGLSDKQKTAIMAKYGISPRNYVYLKYTNDFVNEQITKKMARVSQAAKEAVMAEAATKGSAVVEAARQQAEQEGSTFSDQQAQTLLTQTMVDQLSQLDISINETTAFLAAQEQKRINEEEVARNEAEQKRIDDELWKSKVDNRYKLPWRR